MTGQRRLRQVVEVVVGLAPATFFLFPFLLAAGLGTAMAVVASRAVERATAGLIGWLLAWALGIAALWVVVLSDGARHLGRSAKLVLAFGLLLGMAAAVRWLWVMATSGHRFEGATWTVWLLLLSGPLVVASFRLAQLWSSLRNGAS